MSGRYLRSLTVRLETNAVTPNPLVEEERLHVYNCDNERLPGSNKHWIFKNLALHPGPGNFNILPRDTLSLKPTGETMQSADAKLSRSSLQLALRRYSSVVRDMEQTILLPSLLRDVPYDEAADCEAADNSMDLYEYYLMLKAIKNTVESGLIPHDDAKAKSQAALHKGLEPLLEAQPEALFHFHLRGLFTVMATLAKKSQNLTEKYLNIIGVSH